MRDEQAGGAGAPGPEGPGSGRGDESMRIVPGGAGAGAPPPGVARSTGVPPREPRAGDDWKEDREPRTRDPGAIRAEDTEPYIGLQYVARLFKIVAMVVIVALTAEVVIGIGTEGTQAIIPLFAEVIQGGVLAAILWGASDITLLLIDLGHDVRAARVLLGRMSSRDGAAPSGEQRRTTPR